VTTAPRSRVPRSKQVDRWWRTVAATRRGRIDVGDFGRRVPPLETERDSVYDALVRRFLRPRLAEFTAPGLVLGFDSEPGWTDVLPAAEDVEVLHGTDPSERELAAAAAVDWVVLDRRLQRVPEMAVALGQVVGRLRPGAALVTFFSGVARPEPGEHAPLWSVAPYAARRLHEECRQLERVEVEHHGNVTLALAWIYRLPADDLTERELAAVDPAYPVLVAVTAWKRGRCR
jgi:hypothetical protein